MFWKLVILLFTITPKENCAKSQLENVFEHLEKLLHFIDSHFDEMNIDALIGITLAKAHLTIARDLTRDIYIRNRILKLIDECSTITRHVLNIIPKTSYRMQLIENNLLDANQWATHVKKFRYNNIQDFGIYNNWTALDIKQNRKAEFLGIPTDVCILEILKYSDKDTKCYISPLCEVMMFENRNDTGYLLTHRLLYMQIIHLKQCYIQINLQHYYIKKFCSLIYKELRTSEVLNYPYHDIFLEQSLLCGSEGYAEFLTYLDEIISWQEPAGCYKSFPDDFSKRSSNIIAYGCSDHSTGLATGVLAMYIKFLIEFNIYEYSD